MPGLRIFHGQAAVSNGLGYLKMIGLGRFVHPDVRRGGKQRREFAHHVLLEELGIQISLGVGGGVETVQHLHVFVAHQQLFGLCAGDVLQEGALYFWYTAAAAARFSGWINRVICR